MSDDDFQELARHYDVLMGEIDYDRWVVLLSFLRDLVEEREIRHLDIACGTGQLLHRMRQHGWSTIGIDYSYGMAREASRGPFPGCVAAADMMALPFRQGFGLVTCLFDSLNFLLELDGLRRAVREAAALLEPGGIYYCDTITERMVTEHFADREWEEVHGKMRTKWVGQWNLETKVAELEIRVGTGAVNRITERVYSDAAVRGALKDAGLEVLGCYDAATWKEPTHKTLRVDWVAVKDPAPGTKKRFERARDAIRRALV